MTASLAGRSYGNRTDYIWEKPISFEDSETIDAFLASAIRKGWTAMRIDSETEVRLFIERK